MPDAGPFSTVEEAIAEFRQGRFVIIVDDEDRENEGDLALAAERVTPQAINFMATHGRGLICLALTEERCEQLRLPLMVESERNGSAYGTAFTVSIEARGKVTTGISAADRAATILTAVDPQAGPDDLQRPGHVFPLRARRGGVLARPGQTEASVDLATLAGLAPAGVICEIMNEDGTMARVPELARFAERHGLRMITVSSLIRHRLRHEPVVERVASPLLPTPYGEMRLHGYRCAVTGEEHLALVHGSPGHPPFGPDEAVLARVHSQCVTGDIFGSQRCDCGPQLERALERVATEGGVVVYLRGHEGRGVGLLAKLQAYELQDQGFDTVDANLELGLPVDLREYGIAAAILGDLGVGSIRLLTNNPAKVSGLAAFGIDIAGRLPLVTDEHEDNAAYLRTKRERLGHRFEHDADH